MFLVTAYVRAVIPLFEKRQVKIAKPRFFIEIVLPGEEKIVVFVNERIVRENIFVLVGGADIKDEVDYFKLTAPVEVGTVFEFTADNDKVILTYNNVAYRNGDKIVMADSNIFKVSFAEELYQHGQPVF